MAANLNHFERRPSFGSDAETLAGVMCLQELDNHYWEDGIWLQEWQETNIGAIYYSVIFYSSFDMESHSTDILKGSERSHWEMPSNWQAILCSH